MVGWSPVVMGQACTGASGLVDILRRHELPRPFFSRAVVRYLFGRFHRLHA